MKLLLIDLDDTLIDTTSHKRHVFIQLAKILHVSVSQVEELYEKQKEKGHNNGWIRDFEQLLSDIFHKPVGFLSPILRQTIVKIPLNTHIVNYVKKSDAYKVIFSYGDLEYQNLKISLLELEKEVDELIITPEYKMKFLHTVISDNRVILNNTEYSDVTIIDNDQAFNQDIKRQYPWITVIDPNDLV